MEVTREQLQHGLPKIHEAPKCSLCHESRGLVVSSQGIICGKCYLQNEEVREDAIIQEASRLVQKRGIYAC